VRRAPLMLAMLFSLWPVAVVAVAATNGSSKETDSSSNSSAQQADVARLKELQSQEQQLLQRFHNSGAIHGEPDPSLAVTAQELASSYETWESENGGRDSEADKYEGLEHNVAQRVATFAAHPSQSAMDAFNHAVSEYNSTR
jgi:hypothetical protein